MDVHVAAVMELPTPRTLSECGRVRPSLQDHEGPPIFSKESGGERTTPLLRCERFGKDPS
jgi:hypothetical protein